MGDSTVEGFGCWVFGQTEDLSPVDACQPTGSRDQQEAQRPHAAQGEGVGALARAPLRGRQRVELKAAQQVVGEDTEVLPGTVGPVVVGRHHVKGELPLELAIRLLLAPRPAMKAQSAAGARALLVVTAEYSKYPSSG